MQAIRTRYVGPTNTRGSRIQAKCEAGSVTVGYDHSLNIEENNGTQVMRKRGQRTIDGKVYTLGGRVTCSNAKMIAESEAAAKRARGHLVRLIKLSNVDYLIYEI